MNGLIVIAVVTSLSGSWEFRKTADENTNAVHEAWQTVSVSHD